MKTIYLGISGDIIHPGIINIIREAAKHGEVLIGLLTDSAIASHKRFPYLTWEQRLEVVENIKGVSRVIPQEDWSYIPNLKKYRPDAIIHGDDWIKGPLSKERENVITVMKEMGGEVIEIPYTRGVNSSALNEAKRLLGTTPDIRLKTLRRLIEIKKPVRIMEAHSGLSTHS